MAVSVGQVHVFIELGTEGSGYHQEVVGERLVPAEHRYLYSFGAGGNKQMRASKVLTFLHSLS